MQHGWREMCKIAAPSHAGGDSLEWLGCVEKRFFKTKASLRQLRANTNVACQQVSMVALSAPRDARSKTPPGPEGSNGID